MQKKNLLLILLIAVSFNSKAQLTYKDVAPVFYNRCTSCHHENQHAFPMMNFSETVLYASSIVSKLSDGSMPPWHADTTYTRFIHERHISDTEKNDIIAWINDGAPAGDTTLAPTPPVYTSQYKLQDTPDLVLRIPTFASNATATNDAYNCFSIPTGLTSDRIIRAYEIVPGNDSIVHHVVVSVDTTGTYTGDLTGNCFNMAGDFDIAVYAPGSAPTIFPNQGSLKMGIPLKAGSNIIMQLHYPAGSTGVSDSTQIRIYFYPQGTTGIRPIYVSTPLQNWSLNIPANTIKSFSAQYSVASPISIFATFPHAHALATTMKVCAYKTTDTIPLIKINDWDFDWQGFYTFKKMVKVPATYKLFAKHVYDNTIYNPNNLNDPPINVYAGTSTGDEMLFDSFQWMYYQTGDENIDIESLIANDPLLTSNARKRATPDEITSYAYPNPSANKINLIVTKGAQNENFELKFFDIYGKEVLMNVTHNSGGFVVDKGNLTDGVYLYTIQSEKSFGTGRVVFLSTTKE